MIQLRENMISLHMDCYDNNVNLFQQGYRIGRLLLKEMKKKMKLNLTS